MFAQVVQVYYIINSQGVKRSWRHLFRQRKLKRHHQERDKAGAQASSQAIAEHRKAESQLEKCTSAKFGEIGDWATELKENPLCTLTALAHFTHSLFWALKIRPNVSGLAPRAARGVFLPTIVVLRKGLRIGFASLWGIIFSLSPVS